jgi:hypothetical protein
MRSFHFFNSPNPSGCTRPLGLASIRNEYQKHTNNVSGRVERGLYVGMTTLPQSMSRLSRQCGILNISQPYRPPQPVMGIALLFLLSFLFTTVKSIFPLMEEGM